MRSIFLAGWIAALEGDIRAEEVLPAKKLSHVLMLPQVYLNGHGPFRMIVDTGAAATVLRPEIAERIGVEPLYRVEHVTAAGSKWAPGGKVSVRVGSAVDEGVDVLCSPVALEGADGVLGQSWLERHSYLLDFRLRRVVLDGRVPASSLRLRLQESEGRPSVTVNVDGEPLQVVLDSGAPAMVLFRPVGRFSRRIGLRTNNGAVEAGSGRVVVSLGGWFRGAMTAVELPAAAPSGLLPASAFAAVYVGKREGLVVLVPKEPEGPRDAPGIALGHAPEARVPGQR